MLLLNAFFLLQCITAGEQNTYLWYSQNAVFRYDPLLQKALQFFAFQNAPEMLSRKCFSLKANDDTLQTGVLRIALKTLKTTSLFLSVKNASCVQRFNEAHYQQHNVKSEPPKGETDDVSQK